MKITNSIAASVLVAGLSFGFGSAAVLALSAGSAQARSEKAGDHGKGQGASRSDAGSNNASDKSNGHAYGRSGDHSRGNSANAGRNWTTKAEKAALASDLKNLNAMCANGQAFAHASDNSNIGKMRTYKVKYEAAMTASSDLTDMADNIAANDPNVDTSNLDAQGVQDQIASLTQDKADATWTEGSDGYTQALSDYADGLGVAVGDLTDAQLADFQTNVVQPHNDAVAAQYDPQISDLQAYAAQLDVVANAQNEESVALNTATHGRTLSDAALATFQDALVNGC